jgi:hypothetical protein
VNNGFEPQWERDGERERERDRDRDVERISMRRADSKGTTMLKTVGNEWIRATVG